MTGSSWSMILLRCILKAQKSKYMNLKKEIVNLFPKLPNWVNECILFINTNANLVYGKEYKKYKKKVLENWSQYNNKTDLLKILNYAIENVPYYSKYQKVHSIQEFKKSFGFIDRNIVSEHFNELQSIKIDSNKFDLITTGGTTGKPLKVLLPKNRYIIEKATLHKLWSQVGFNHHKRAVLRNHKLPKGAVFKLNPITKEYLFDGFRIDDDYLFEVYNTIKRKNIRYVHAYPSNAYTFAKFMYNNKLDASLITAFISSSENVYDYQKDFIKNTLGLKFFTFFGHSEKIIIGGSCPGNDAYHIEPTYGYFELIDEEGNNIKEIGKVGEIVGTTLNNYGMPLIRYRTDDFAEYAGDYCESCHRKVILIKNVSGRWSGRKIYGHDGTMTTPTALNFHDSLFTVIDGLQYVQESKGELTVRIIKGGNFTEGDAQRIIKHYKKKLGKTMRVTIKYVNEVEKQPNGKFLDLISKV